MDLNHTRLPIPPYLRTIFAISFDRLFIIAPAWPKVNMFCKFFSAFPSLLFYAILFFDFAACGAGESGRKIWIDQEV
ncbi:hypothetical protein D5272_06100 [bacterium D16-76]|nr:hypothetical protein [bacterium D16-76]